MIRTAPEAATPPAPVVLPAPVRQVTMLEDRAQVVREGVLDLPPGSHRVVIRGVSPVAADRSVVVRAGAGARVHQALVVRRWRIGAQERPADAAELAGEQLRLGLLLRQLEERQRIVEQQRGLNEQAAARLLEGLARELPFAKEFDAQRGVDLESFFAVVRELDLQLASSGLELRELRSRLQALQLRAQDGGRPDHHLETELHVDVEVQAAGRRQLQIEYVVACALWRPIHRATLTGGKVRFECEGAVWQATGEDWTDVALSFSTARPTQRAEPPVLVDDELQVRRRVDRRVEVAVRDQAIATTGEGAGRESSDLPGVDDGGETRRLTGLARATIASDGRLRRVPIFAFEAPAEVDRLCRPERSLAVHLRSRQDNLAPAPLLAGPVELLRDSGYVGRGELGFVAPGERFALAWGPDDAVRVRREPRESRDTTLLTGKQVIIRTVELFLSNLDDGPAVFRLEERIPVSELEQVEIRLDEKETSPKAAPDAQGIVAWPVTIPPRGTQKLKLGYKVLAAADVQGI